MTAFDLCGRKIRKLVATSLFAAATFVTGGNSRADYLHNGNPCALLNTASCSTSSNDYYKSNNVLDHNGTPTTARGTFSAWKSHMGFPPKPDATGHHVLFYDYSQLRFARDVHCRKVTNPTDINVAYACYVVNYAATDTHGIIIAGASKALHNAHAGAPRWSIFAMEYNNSPTAIHPVSFIVYDGQTEKPVTSTVFDSEGPKRVPFACMSCHGGVLNVTSIKNKDAVSASFLPFDTLMFSFGGNTAVERQNPEFVELNRLVYRTNPAKPISALIDRWYNMCGGGGSSLPPQSCMFEDNDAPAGECTGASAGEESCGWHGTVPPNGGAIDRVAFYQSTIRRYCRTCHMTTSFYNFENFCIFNQLAIYETCSEKGQPFLGMPNSGPAASNYSENTSAMKGMKKLVCALKQSTPSPCPH